jgi:hypothetical protein
MTRKVPDIYSGNTQKKRDRLSFKNFVLEVIEDTFINEFEPTSSSLDSATQTLFTLFLGPSDKNNDGDTTDVRDIAGYEFTYEDLKVDDAFDYLDVFLYSVRRDRSEYDVELYDENGTQLTSGQFANGTKEIRFIFKEDITRVPTEVDRTDFLIKGKITEIQQ